MSDSMILAAVDRVLTGLSAAPQDVATDILRNAGWIETGPSGPRLTGRGAVVGLDLGGTKLRAAISDASGTTLHEMVQPTEPDALAQIAALVGQLTNKARLDPAALSHIALGVPGAVRPDGRVHLSPNVRIDPGINLAATLSKSLQRPVTVWNDGTLAAYGEYVTDPNANMSLAFLALGTGVGMGLILNGQPVHGRNGAAGEIAFLPFGPDPYASAAAHAEGGFEAAVSSAAISAAYQGGSHSVKAIFDLAEAGDPQAAALTAQLTANIAIGIAATIALFDPGLVVIGGGIGARPGLAEAIAERVRQLTPTQCVIRASLLGDRAGVIGALHLAQDLARRDLLTSSALRGAA